MSVNDFKQLGFFSWSSHKHLEPMLPIIVRSTKCDKRTLRRYGKLKTWHQIHELESLSDQKISMTQLLNHGPSYSLPILPILAKKQKYVWRFELGRTHTALVLGQDKTQLFCSTKSSPVRLVKFINLLYVRIYGPKLIEKMKLG